MRYRDEGVPLIVLAGREYGSGSSRDWAAKGTTLLGVRAVIAESFERIHRSNLVGMGDPAAPVPAGRERRLARADRARALRDRWAGGRAFAAPAGRRRRDERRRRAAERRFEAIARLDGPIDVDYFEQGGILPAVLRRLAATN